MPSSSLFLRSSTTLVLVFALFFASAFANHYALDTAYQGANFFDGFSFFTVGHVELLARSVKD